jgi:hypothetical protein
MIAICCNAFQILSALAVSKKRGVRISHLIVSNSLLSKSIAEDFCDLLDKNSSTKLIYVSVPALFMRFPILYYLKILVICRFKGFFSQELIIRSKLGIIEKCWIAALSPDFVWLVEDGFGDIKASFGRKSNLTISNHMPSFRRWLERKVVAQAAGNKIKNTSSVFFRKSGNENRYDCGKTQDISTELIDVLKRIARVRSSTIPFKTEFVLLLPSVYMANDKSLDSSTDVDVDFGLVGVALNWIHEMFPGIPILISLHPRSPSGLVEKYEASYDSSEIRVLGPGVCNADVLMASGQVGAVVATYSASSLVVAANLFELPSFCFRVEDYFMGCKGRDSDVDIRRFMGNSGITFVEKKEIL